MVGKVAEWVRVTHNEDANVRCVKVPDLPWYVVRYGAGTILTVASGQNEFLCCIKDRKIIKTRRNGCGKWISQDDIVKCSLSDNVDREIVSLPPEEVFGLRVYYNSSGTVMRLDFRFDPANGSVTLYNQHSSRDFWSYDTAHYRHRYERFSQFKFEQLVSGRNTASVRSISEQAFRFIMEMIKGKPTPVTCQNTVMTKVICLV